VLLSFDFTVINNLQKLLILIIDSNLSLKIVTL
jgi:hypothetical protein